MKTQSNIRWAIRRIAEIAYHPAKQRDIWMEKEWMSGYMKETFIQQDYKWLADRLKPNTVVLDIGAAIGDSAIYFAGFPNAKKIISFEPVPKVYALGKRMLAESPKEIRDKVDFINAAISDKEGSKSITSLGWDGYAFSEREKEKVSQEIVQHTLSNILKEIKEPVVIKCDIEGDEKIIFDDVDLKNVYAIELETHWNCRDTMREKLQEKGYKTTDLTDLNESGCNMMGAWR